MLAATEVTDAFGLRQFHHRSIGRIRAGRDHDAIDASARAQASQNLREHGA